MVRIRSTSGANSWCSNRKRSATSVEGDDAPTCLSPRSARSAFRIANTSMHSCTMAPATGTSSPNAPRSIPPNASPIPITTLCSAIRRERRAIAIASAIRSSRSTTRTTSAASDDAVAPRAPIATPTSAAASAGASFSPSPTKIVTPSSRSASTALTFSAGSRSDRTRSTPSAAPTDSATSGWSPVTMTTRLIPARRSVRITRGESGRIGSSMTNAPVTTRVDGDEHARRTVERRPPTDVARPPRHRRSRRDERRLPQRDVPAVDLALDAGPVLLDDVGREREVETVLPRRADDRRGQHVGRHLVERGGQAQQLVRGHVVEHLDVGDLRDARPSACRSCRTAAPSRRASVSSAPPPFTMIPRRAAREMPATTAIGTARIKRAGRGDHQHAQRAHRVAGQQPGGAGDHERDRDEDHRVAVGHPHERGLLLLRLRDQPDDARVRALGGGRHRSEVDGGPRVHRAGSDRVAVRPLGRAGLAGERRLVEHARRTSARRRPGRPRPSSRTAGRPAARRRSGGRPARRPRIA